MFKLGFDGDLLGEGIKIPLLAPLGHTIIVGGTGSGKSTHLLYLIHNALDCQFMICDFKRSGELTGISDRYAEFEESYDLIKEFYHDFWQTPEGGAGFDKILLIDEIAGMLTYYGMNKEGKAKADEIRQIMASILMLGRSRRCYLWLSMQRYTASIFPASSGAGDNFNICIGLGKLSPDSKRSLFAGMELESEFQPGQGKGIVYIDGQGLRAICVPRIDKRKLLGLLRKKQENKNLERFRGEKVT